jgi:hypothetical protein
MKIAFIFTTNIIICNNAAVVVASLKIFVDKTPTILNPPGAVYRNVEGEQGVSDVEPFEMNSGGKRRDHRVVCHLTDIVILSSSHRFPLGILDRPTSYIICECFTLSPFV